MSVVVVSGHPRAGSRTSGLAEEVGRAFAAKRGDPDPAVVHVSALGADLLVADAPATAEALALIRGAVTRVGTKSFGHELRLYEADSMTHCATQKSVEVCFDTQARKGVALPEDLRSKLSAIL